MIKLKDTTVTCLEKKEKTKRRIVDGKMKVALLLYPEDKIKRQWDYLIYLVLFAFLIIQPLRMFFGEIDGPL